MSATPLGGARARMLRPGLLTLCVLLLFPARVAVRCAQLCAEQEGVRHGTSLALRRLVRECVTETMVAAGLSSQAAPSARGAQPPLVSCVAAVAGALGARQQEGWLLAIPGELTQLPLPVLFASLKHAHTPTRPHAHTPTRPHEHGSRLATRLVDLFCGFTNSFACP